MSVELLYTSAPQGLKQGSRGFSTVLCTAGLPVNLASRLEGLSGYRHVFPPTHAQASSNPVCHSHLRFVVGGKPISILSRISDYGIDYSQRTNKLAHHVVIETAEQPAAGPAWLLSQAGFMRSSWDGSCQTLATGPAIPRADQPVSICHTWHSVMGDAGWGGVVAEAFASQNAKPLWIVYRLEQSGHLLKLINEAIALLPSQDRWRATFSTYVTNLPPEADCKVRCVLEGSEEARVAIARGTVVNVMRPIAVVNISEFVNVARSGRMDKVPSTVSRISISDIEQSDNLLTGDDNETIVEEDIKTAPPAAPLILSRPKLPARVSRTQLTSASALSTPEPLNSRWPAVGVITVVVLLFLSTTYLIYLRFVESKEIELHVASQSEQKTATAQVANSETEGSHRKDEPQQDGSGGTKKTNEEPMRTPPGSNDTLSNGQENKSGESLDRKNQEDGLGGQAKQTEQKNVELPVDSKSAMAESTKESIKVETKKDSSTPCYVVLERLLNGKFYAIGNVQLPVTELDRLWIHDGSDKTNLESWGAHRNWQTKLAGDPKERRGEIEDWHVEGTRMTIELGLSSKSFAAFALTVKTDFEVLEKAVAEFNASSKKLASSIVQQEFYKNIPPNQRILSLPVLDKRSFSITQVENLESNPLVSGIRNNFSVIANALQMASAAESKNEVLKQIIAELEKLKEIFELTVRAGEKMNASLKGISGLTYYQDSLIKVTQKELVKERSFMTADVTSAKGKAVPVRFHFLFNSGHGNVAN